MNFIIFVISKFRSNLGRANGLVVGERIKVSLNRNLLNFCVKL